MVSFLKHIGEWFIGKSEKIEKLEEEIKAVIYTQTKRAFGIGVVFGIVLTMVTLNLL